ncbi:hypothetical protein [Paenibacillus humicola]|uniref:hypothetical protein n=1 Tax=Paenibacillus humicola TaxID=3110540 RepID=UPI00237A6136|nr:hypothetical protein [Paenibacillus humicola]
MSQAMLGLNAAVTVAFVLVSLLAGHSTGGLAYRKTVGALRTAAKVNLALIAVLGALSAFKIAFTFYNDSISRFSNWESSALIVLLTVLPCTVIAFLSVPRLLRVSRIPENDPGEPSNRTKRRMAAQPALVVPVQTLAAGSLLFTFKEALPLPESGGKQLADIAALFLAVSSALLWRQSVRRRRIHRDDGSSVLHRVRRLGVYSTACALLLYGMFYTVVSARSVTEPNNRYELELGMSSGKAVIQIGKAGLRIEKVPLPGGAGDSSGLICQVRCAQ